MTDQVAVEGDEMSKSEDHKELKVEEPEAHEVEVVEEVEEEEKKHEEVDYKEKFYYLAAELENLRRRHDKEKSDLLKYGNERILSGLLEVLDNFERTMEAIQNDEDEKVKNIYVGIEMVQKQFLELLKKSGLEPVESLGEIFDPNFHEAMAQQPAEGKKENEIISVFQKGYKLNGRLLRAAKVIVAKKD
jgi:molecular chaperone GrpE